MSEREAEIQHAKLAAMLSNYLDLSSVREAEERLKAIRLKHAIGAINHDKDE
jgi:hypothetical protein